MKIALFTLGCKVNQYESQAISELCKNAGHTLVEINDNPNVIIVNSCTVTAESDRKTGQIVRRYKKKFPNSVIVLTGCMAQAFPEKAKEIFEADLVLGNTNYNEIVKKIEQFFYTENRIVDITPHQNNELFNSPSITEFNERTRAYMKIEDGCNRFCSYCIIPTARGRVRSRSLESIKNEAINLSNNGFCEIVLVGINLSAYGSDIGLELGDAVETVAKIDGIKRIRLGSLEPDQISDRTFSILKDCKKFCPQFHLSLQSGSDNTLKAMNRHYTSEFYFKLIEKIRATFKNPSITTDIMVGFAGETEKDFEDSLKFADKIGFAKAHIFAYSRRKGTRAYNMENQISNKEKSKRSKLMISHCNVKEFEFHKLQVGLISTVLFETNEENYAIGYTENYTRVKVKTNTSLQRKILKVKIIKAEQDFCFGELI